MFYLWIYLFHSFILLIQLPAIFLSFYFCLCHSFLFLFIMSFESVMLTVSGYNCQRLRTSLKLCVVCCSSTTTTSFWRVSPDSLPLMDRALVAFSPICSRRLTLSVCLLFCWAYFFWLFLLFSCLNSDAYSHMIPIICSGLFCIQIWFLFWFLSFSSGFWFGYSYCSDHCLILFADR
jgi:hypothetical protein